MAEAGDILLLVLVALSAAVLAVRPDNVALKWCAFLVLLYVCGVIVYRLYFHSLSRFPGPKMAGLTYLYEFYYDVLKAPGGQYYLKLEELHGKYGPILRITPDEVQVNDADFFEKLYVTGSSKRHRWETAGTGKTSPGSIAAAVSHDLHRIRRNSLSKFFSKAAVMRLESRLQSKMASLCQKLEEAVRCGEIINISTTFSMLTLSIISEYSFGKSWDDQGEEFVLTMREGFNSMHLLKYFPVMHYVPRPILEQLLSVARVVSKWETVMLDSRLPESEKETQRIADEALILVIAGTESTSRTLSTAIYHILTQPAILSNLRDELDKAIPDSNAEIPVAKAELLPYLTAVLKEANRITALLTNRSLFTAEQPLQYKEWTIQPGAAMCVNYRAVLYNEDIFPEPERFDPSRWLGDSEEVPRRNRHFIAFGRGHRSCLGVNLAWAELYLAAANMFRKFDMQLHDTVYERDVKIVRDCNVGFPSLQSKGVRIEILNRRS
ncbi:cytochrome P450 [Rhizodiscina lignyota]|uniref:Cytochrome P450 n=1 Tax=Rhizodiscina lignyota TaxID=1504668 RepID=A0A9P4I9N7_9PEZI|nr:cytochrome P450 [Rhizodiscina lignyota]